MKENQEDVVKNILNEESLPNDIYNINNEKNSYSNKLIVKDISDNEIKEKNEEDYKLYLGEVSNKEKIFSVLDKISKSSNKRNNEPDVIVLRNIHKTYLIGIEGVPALRGVSLNVKKGEFLTIFGTSGGGKTTMLNIIGTIDTPSRGDVKIFEKLIKSDTSDKDLSNVNNPNILLLDEPTGDLDTKNADIVMSILLELNLLHGITMIMVTHDVSLKNFGEKIVRVIDGKIHHEIEVPIEDRKECIKQLYERLEKNMGIREGTQSSNISKNIEESGENGNNGNNNIKNKKGNKTVYRKIEDYPIKKFHNSRKSNISSIN